MAEMEDLYARYNDLPTQELEDILYDIEVSAALTLGMNTFLETQHKHVLRKILTERGVDVNKLLNE